MPKDPTSELAGLSSHYPFSAERQAGKLAVNTNIWSILVGFDKGIETRSSDYEAKTRTTNQGTD